MTKPLLEHSRHPPSSPTAAPVSPAPGIALLTPYSGTNLGDGAIQTAAIEGLRRYLPDARLHGLTLSPPETARRHGIPAFPLTGLLVEFYAESLFDPPTGFRVGFRDAGGAQPVANSGPSTSTPTEPTGRVHVLWERLKLVPVLGPLLKLLLRLIRAGLIILHEIRHVGASFRFVKGVDMVVAAGGGQLDEEWGGAWGHPYVLLRWALLTRIARKKFAVISVGVGKLHSVLGRLFTRLALRLACYRSYRDQGSKQLLHAWKFTRDDPCVPDLAFSVEVSEFMTSSASAREPTMVGVSPIAFGHSANWPTPEPVVHAAYLAGLTEFVRRLVSSDHRVVLLASSGADRRIVRELRDAVAARCPTETRDRIEVPPVETVTDFLDAVGRVDLMVVSRLHGAILAHMLNRPLVAISFDRKVDAHMADMGQSAYLLNIATVTAEELSQRFEALSADAGRVRDTLRARLATLRDPLERQYRHLADLVRANG